MSMGSNIRNVLMFTVVVFLGLVFVVLILFALAATGGPVTAGTSTALTSAGNESITLLPWIAVMFCAGLVFIALERR